MNVLCLGLHFNNTSSLIVVVSYFSSYFGKIVPRDLLTYKYFDRDVPPVPGPCSFLMKFLSHRKRRTIL